MNRAIAVVTVARSDFGIYAPILRALVADEVLTPRLIVGGTHMLESHGRTIDEITAAGLDIGARVDGAAISDSPTGVVHSMGAHLAGFADAYSTLAPDLVLVLGDRYEMHAAALAALPFNLPVAHVHGGEITEGAFDDALRHSITKLSHLHFVAMPEHGRRVRQMGEEAWRVTVTGAPALDGLADFAPISDEELEDRIGLPLDEPPIVVTFHPVTLEWNAAEAQVRALLDAIDKSGRPAVFTAPNADTGRDSVAAAIEAFADASPRASMVRSLGSRAYFSLLRRAVAMVGNSSSGLIEAPSFQLPVVNVGTRQDGRTRAANVIDCPADAGAIAEALDRACSPAFRQSLHGLSNPYGDGHAAERIVRVMHDVELGDRLIRKRFVDQTVSL